MSDQIDDLVVGARTLAKQLLEQCASEGVEIFITSTLRTIYEQDRLYAQGRTEPGNIVTYARGGYSKHNHGSAFDVAFRSPPASSAYGDDNPWDRVGAIGKDLGLQWGGDWTGFRDRPHFQLPSPYSVKLLRAASIGRLRRGIRAERAAVEELQALLNDAGFVAGSTDGSFGPRTEQAVQELQRACDFLPSGIVQLRELGELEARLG